MLPHKLIIQIEFGLAAVSWQPDISVQAVGAPLVPFSLTFEELAEEMKWYAKYVGGSDEEQRRAVIFERKMKRWGEKLFRTVFENPESPHANRYFQQAVQQAGLENCDLVISSNDPDALTLPWELMRSVYYGYVAPQFGGLYRTVPRSATHKPFPEGPQKCLNVLLVIARPMQEDDIIAGVLARPLMKSLGPLIRRGRVKLKILRPPTFLAFDEELSENKGHYHIVHYNGHGAFGRLMFERANGGEDPIWADQIADSLRLARVPLVILDACNSGAVFIESYGSKLNMPSEFVEHPPVPRSIATELIALGTKAVVAMSGIILATTSSNFMVKLYEELVKGRSVAESVAAGRRLLYMDRERKINNVRFKLSDWMIPVLYLQDHYAPFLRSAKGKSSFRAAVDLGAESRIEKTLLVGFPEQGPYTFTGRSEEMLDLQRSLEIHKVVVLVGPKGQGKTELSAELARMLVRSSGRQMAFYYSFKRGGDLQNVVSRIGGSFTGKHFGNLDHKRQRNGVLNYLRGHRCLLILDQFECISRKKKKNRESKTRFYDLAHFASKLSAAETFILIISREEEEWLSRRHKRMNLLGFSEDDGLDFANHVLLRAGIRPRDLVLRTGDNYEAIVSGILNLVDVLSRNPLLMIKVLPKLAYKDPKELAKTVSERLKKSKGIFYA
eukprot:Plantae.Rhodophyta-Hildenbrandia_rubra.ctg11769.p1 GENE.Plantae.Rhodophyta-Hildenbrandia_rubra.ctg11769~~Plantae.Rhodophyta-Hildenbrandia_rubra.ctg11769.p1  ORF type:complete len:669 (-),score=80.82 Plantae.Rhodophyta-Hildenbrandia_rubra.ctg11769:1799-3805(-)